MLTPFGKAIRVFRMDRDEKLIDMARKLGISESYLSMIENGHKPITDELMQRIKESYVMDRDEWYKLLYAQAKTEMKMELVIENPKTIDMALLFVLKVNTLSKERRKEIFEMLKEG